MFNVLKLFVIMLPIAVTQAIKCESLDNQPCLARETIVNINSNEPRYYPFAIKLNKCTGSCDTLDSPLAKICKANETKKKIVRVYDILFNKYRPLMINKDISCDCKCRFNSSVCNAEQKWNRDKCRCECGMGKCKKGFVWDYSICRCRCERCGVKTHNFSLGNLDDKCDESSSSVTISTMTTKNHRVRKQDSINDGYIILTLLILVLISISVFGVSILCWKRQNNQRSNLSSIK